MSLLSSLGIVAGWSEKRFARSVGLAMLEIHHREHAAHPELSGKELYARIVAAQLSTDHETASRLVRQAGESFADWPNWREMTFRDVVNYIAITEFARTNPGRGATKTNIGRVVSRIIPGDL